MLRRQESETDLAGRKGDVWVRNASREMDCRRGEGIVWRNRDAEVPEPACSLPLAGNERGRGGAGGKEVVSVSLRSRVLISDLTFVRRAIHALEDCFPPQQALLIDGAQM